MLIGIPKETKIHEYRVGATPSKVKLLVDMGHSVIIETGAAERIGFTDKMYEEAGAKIVPSAKQVYEADLIIKIKEPQEAEFPLLKKGQTLFCYLHLAPDAKQTEALVKSGVTAIAYETVFDELGRLPLLTPMSELAGRIAIQAGATALQMVYGGKGVLLGGVPGVLPGKVVVIGAGVVGTHAARMAMGLGADVTVLDRNLNRLRDIDVDFNFRMKTLFSSPQNMEKVLEHADLVVGAVLIPGKSAPRLVTREMVRKMEKGTVLVDVAIDQGGCFETSRPTTHESPLYEVDGVVHYCVTNMPGACAKTATEALTSATIPYTQKLVEMGVRQALLSDKGFLQGLNVCGGKVTNEHVASDLGYEYVPPEKALA